MTATLTPRHRPRRAIQAEVLARIAAGQTRKQVAAAFGITTEAVRYRLLRAKNAPPPEETRAEVDARIAREVAAGERCRVCWLLLPCHDHGSF